VLGVGLTREDEGHHPSMEASGSGLLMICCRLARIKLAVRLHEGGLEGEEEGRHPNPVCRLTCLSRTSLNVSLERQPVQVECGKTMV
jgi:hypothetical protein